MFNCYGQLALSNVSCIPKGRNGESDEAGRPNRSPPAFPIPPHEEPTTAALRFLDSQELQTGIVLGREDGSIEFRHYSYQEYLACQKEIGSMTDDEWQNHVDTHLRNPKWREVFRFLPAVLHSLGPARVHLFVRRVLDSRDSDDVTEEARIVGPPGLLPVRLSGARKYSVREVPGIRRPCRYGDADCSTRAVVHSTWRPASSFFVALGRGGDMRFNRSWRTLRHNPCRKGHARCSGKRSARY